jgi:response regulator RpfG family c-di-GMP phosphodiesterase
MCTPNNPCRLLIIEDSEPIINLLLAENKHGEYADYALDCTVARTLEEAKKIIRTADRPFDVISIDPELPDSDGINTYEAIHAMPEARDLPKFVYTGGVDSSFRQVVINHGAERIFTKDNWFPSHYLTVLHYAAGQHRARERVKKKEQFYKSESERLAGELSAIRAGIPQSKASQALERIIGDLNNRLAAAS